MPALSSSIATRSTIVRKVATAAGRVVRGDCELQSDALLFCTRLRWKLAGIEFGEYLANAPDNLIRAMIMEDVQTGLEEAPKAF